MSTHEEPIHGRRTGIDPRTLLLLHASLLCGALLVIATLTFAVQGVDRGIGSMLCAGLFLGLLIAAAAGRWPLQIAAHGWYQLWQEALNISAVTALIYGTGGPISPFLFLYLPLVMTAATGHSRSAALVTSLFAAGMYSLLVRALVWNWIPMADGSATVPLPANGLLLQILGLLSGMALIAIATSFLARKVHFTNTEAEASRRALQEFIAHQRQLVNELPDAVITTDHHYSVSTLNQAASALLGFEEPQVTGRNLFEVLEEVSGTSAEIHKLNSKQEEFELSFEKFNRYHHLLCRVKAVRNMDGGTAGHLFIFHDVTELKSVEEQLQVHERMAKLLSLASHDQESPGLVRTKLTHFVGESAVMQQVFKLIQRVAGSNATVLVSGESGTGKELVARAIHLGSSRAQMPFVPVNCGAIPENLLESELFGYKRGAFTGAHQDYSGMFKQADGGTLFLDEIGELPLHMQTKLLRAIQEKSIRHLGGDRSIPVDVRIIAASNRNLKKEVEAGRFREDLFYRLNVINLVIPPLRERREDIPPLVNSILKSLISEGKTPVVPPATMTLMMNYSYPGNVRELENMLERAYVLGGEVILPEHLPEVVRLARPLPVPREETEILVLDDIEFPVNLEEILQAIECRYLEAALKKTGGAKKRAAELLGINFRSFRYRVSKFGLAASDDE